MQVLYAGYCGGVVEALDSVAEVLPPLAEGPSPRDNRGPFPVKVTEEISRGSGGYNST